MSKVKFPSIKHVAIELRRINKYESAPESGDDDQCTEVRLCIEEDGSWCLLWGDPQYDQRHYPMCGSSSVPGDNRRFNSRDVAKDLLAECRDQCTENVEPEPAPMPMTNTLDTLANASPETIIALDAIEAKHPEAYKLLENVPATICYANDRYEAKIMSATPSLHTIVARFEGRFDQNGHKVERFRRDKRGVYRAKGGSPRLHIGTAETYLTPEI